MRTVLSQGHAQNLRDLILNYELDEPEKRLIDFTYGKGGLWRIEHKYRLELTRTDAIPTEGNVIKKDLVSDDYSDLGAFDAALFDPPYLYGNQQAFDMSNMMNGTTSWQHTGDMSRFTLNKTEGFFIERIDAVNRVSLQCLKKDAFLFVKVMDTRIDGYAIPNHVYCINHLTNFKLSAVFVYLAAGASTWKHQAETSHGYWLVMKMAKDGKQQTL